MKSKLLGLLLLALAFLAPSAANAANCFWFGGTGNIDDTTKWFAATNGGGGACAAAGGWPNSTADNGTFDANSGGGTITRNVNWTIGTLNIAAFTGTFGNSGDTASVNLNTFTNNGSGTRTINYGASTWTCGVSGTTTCTWTIAGATNLTSNANTSSLVFSGSTAGVSQGVSFGLNYTYNNVTFLPDNGVANRLGTSINAQNTTFANLTIGAPNWVQFTSSSANWTITGTLAFSGGTPSFSAYTTIINSAFQTTTLTLSGGAATCDYCVFKGITAATNSITANNSLSGGGLTNITVNPATGVGGGNHIIGSL